MKTTFATACWEGDWKTILLKPNYLAEGMIGRHRFNFARRLLVINNVADPEEVIRAAKRHIAAGVLTDIVMADPSVLPAFQLKRSDFTSNHPSIPNDWIYYNALAPLTAIHAVTTDYLLYQTGDVWLKKNAAWIASSIHAMQKRPTFKVANLTWNDNYREARQEAYRSTLRFYVSNRGFSDQMFLVQSKDFQQPIYGILREDAAHFPRGDVFEKRVFSYMLTQGWERITFRWASYVHGMPGDGDVFEAKS
jgi:hypothetical protein